LLDDEGIREVNVFSTAGLANIMREAAINLNKASQYEGVNDLYKLLLPIYEKHRNYKELSSCHKELHEIFDSIIESSSHQRFFGSYYRVAFFGSKFEELDGKEYIYKEPGLTKLGEITNRLKAFYETRMGQETPVKIVGNSNTVAKDLTDLDTNCYIQITFVDPYLENWELRERVNYYDRCHNLQNFVFSSPFTKSGKSQTDDVSEQWKRKTILTIGSYFPYMTRRVEVKSKIIEELTPLKNSMETLRQRTSYLSAEIINPQLDTKILQPLLHGAVNAVIHQGPIGIAAAFLNKDKKLDIKYSEEEINQLKREMREFLDVCKEALDKNDEMTSGKEKDLHNQFDQSYKELKIELEKYLTD